MPSRHRERKLIIGGARTGFILACVGVSLLGFPPPAVALGTGIDQEFEPLPAAKGPPPGLAVGAAERPPRPPRTPPAVEELLSIVRQQPGGSEKVEKARAGNSGRALPAAARPPRDLAETRGRPPQPPRRPPSVDQLLEIVRQQPGGQRKIEAARGGNRGRAGGSDLLSWFKEWLNPFRVKEAYAAAERLVTLGPSNDYLSSNPYAWARFHGGRSITGSGMYLELPVLGHRPKQTWTSIERPAVQLYVNVPRTGWYVITFNHATTGFDASLFRQGEAGKTLETWSFASGDGWRYRSSPALLYLARGSHYLVFMVTRGLIQFPWSITIDTLP